MNKQSIGILFALCASRLWAPAWAQDEAVYVGVENAQKQLDRGLINYPGKVLYSRKFYVDSPVYAVTDKVFVQNGDQVTKGQLLAKLNTDEYEDQIALNNKQTDILNIQMQHYKEQLDIYSSIKGSATVSMIDISRVKSDLASANEQIAEMAIRKSILERKVEQAQIKSPVDGIVLAAWLSEGTYTNVNDRLFELVNHDDLELSVHLPASAVRHVNISDSVSVLPRRATATSEENPTPVPSNVTKIIPNIEGKKSFVDYRISLPDGLSLHNNDWVEVQIPTQQPVEVYSVSSSAVVRMGKDAFVYRIDNNSVAHQVPVHFHGIQGQKVLLTGELNEGDRIVIEGATKLSDNSKVTTSGS